MGDSVSNFGSAGFGAASTSNATTSPLSSGATYTGSWEQNDYPQVMAVVETDNPGTLYFDFSQDGTNSASYPTNGFRVQAGVNEFHTAVKGPRYFRVRLVNDTGAQSYLRLKVYFGAHMVPSVAPLNQARSLDADAILTRPTFPWLDISRGLTTGISTVQKFGRNTAVGTSFVPVALGGVYQTPQSGSATTLRIKAGGNANDTAAGTGARAVTLQGLDENFALVEETLATAGASASSATTTTFTRLFRAWVSSSGTYATAAAGSHSGNIVIENGAGGTDWLTIDSTGFPKGQSEVGAYSVPAGSTAHIFLTDVTIDSGKTVDLLFFHRAGADDTSAPYSAMRAKSVLTGIQSTGLPVLTGRTIPFGPFVGPCDVGFMAKVSATTGSVSVEFEIFLIEE